MGRDHRSVYEHGMQHFVMVFTMISASATSLVLEDEKDDRTIFSGSCDFQKPGFTTVGLGCQS